MLKVYPLLLSTPAMMAPQLPRAVTAPDAMTLPVPSALVAHPGTYTRPRFAGPVNAVRRVITAAISSGISGLADDPATPAELDAMRGWLGWLRSRIVTD